jgi:drug/metabolite transporter (DMT)-like permease
MKAALRAARLHHSSFVIRHQFMAHRQAVALMLLVTLLWSTAGVITRQLESARSFEVTFWRSGFNAVALIVLLSAWRGPQRLWAQLRAGGRVLWWSGVCWCVMYTAFMVAITLTTVANVLITMALAPLFTALMARFGLGHRLPTRTWVAIAVAGAGIAWMYAAELRSEGALLGTLVALAVPVAAALNWVLIQSQAHNRNAPDFLPAVLIGALLSALLTLPWAWPLQASAPDLGWLAVLGTFQLAVPCVLAVLAARVLPAPEISLLALLEVIFGTLWAWLWANEVPHAASLGGGLTVLVALATNEALALKSPGG